jgi:hypothetical protein
MARPKDPHLAAVADIYHSHRYADGGEVEPQQKLSWYGAGDDERAQRAAQMQAGFMKSAQDNPVSKAIAWLTGSGQQQQQNGHGYAKGGKVDAMVSPGEVYLSPKEVKKVAKEGKSPLGEGEKVPGKPKVPGDSYANDTVPKKLEAGGIVIPNSVLQSDDPEGEAAKFVKKLLGQKKEHGHFQKALKQAIASRKS